MVWPPKFNNWVLGLRIYAQISWYQYPPRNFNCEFTGNMQPNIETFQLSLQCSQDFKGTQGSDHKTGFEEAAHHHSPAVTDHGRCANCLRLMNGTCSIHRDASCHIVCCTTPCTMHMLMSRCICLVVPACSSDMSTLTLTSTPAAMHDVQSHRKTRHQKQQFTICASTSLT